MKSKFVMLISIGALALGASVPNAMAVSRANARGPISVSKSTRAIMAKKSVSKTALPSSHATPVGLTIK